MDKNVNDLKKTTVPIKAKTTTEVQEANLQDGQFLVTVKTGFAGMLKADKAKKKLVFDFTNMPVFSGEEIQQLSNAARLAYTMDMRMSGKAAERIADGRSPFSDVKESVMMDPLASAHVRNKTVVQNGKDDLKYLFVDPNRVESLQKAGYALVKQGDSETIPHGEEVDGKMVIKNSSNKVDVVAMKVDKKNYDQHIAYYGHLSKQRLGQHLAETKESMNRYAPKVNIYDESKLTR